MSTAPRTRRLTGRIGSIVDIQHIIRNPTSQISHTQHIERLIVQLGIVASQHGSSKETQVLEAVLLRAFGPDDCVLCDLVEGLVRGERGGVGSWTLVVEPLAAERSGVEVGRDGQNPRGGYAIERLCCFSCCYCCAVYDYEEW